MKERLMLRQVAIAITASGGLGYGDKLAFASKTDLSAFSVFTKRTVLVVGNNTAKQMLNAGVEPTVERPWVVISRGGQAQHVNEPYKHMLYATDLGPATELAEQMVFNDGRLCGYTIVGGAQTYEKLITSMGGEGSIGEINSAYILKLAEPDAAPDVKLSVGADKFESLVRSNMVGDTVLKRIKAGYQGRDGANLEQRVEGEAVYLIDNNTYDPSDVQVSGNMLTVDCMDKSVFHCRLTDIAGWSVEAARNTITLWFAQRDLNKEFRLDSKRQGLNYLDLVLRRNIV